MPREISSAKSRGGFASCFTRRTMNRKEALVQRLDEIGSCAKPRSEDGILREGEVFEPDDSERPAFVHGKWPAEGRVAWRRILKSILPSKR